MATQSFLINPWSRRAGEDGALKDTLSRVNFERGHFRDITETSLQEEIAADGALPLSTSDDEEEEDDEEPVLQAREKPSTREDLYKARYEMLANIASAQQEVAMSLDFVSLLISKDAPKQGNSTISPVLKKEVPTGSLGVDIWHRMPVDKPREAQDELLATNVKMESLQQSADGLLSAATRLQDNVRKETEYWHQVLTISEEGWNICRVPGQQHKLAVHFGFGESAPEFSRRGVAALNMTSNGKVSLDRGVGRKPRGLHAVLRRGSRVVGTSRLPDPPDSEETTLESRIRYARDSLYDEELYHEMIRESRILSALGVSMAGSAIQFTVSAGLSMSLDLVALDDMHDLRYDPSNPEDRLAQAAVMAARLLLTHAHRERLTKRSAMPAPLSDKKKDERPTLQILRPMVSFVTHQASTLKLNKYLNSAMHTLEKAKINTGIQRATISLPQPSSEDTSGLISSLTRPWQSEGQFTIHDVGEKALELSITVHTDLSSDISTKSKFILTSPYLTESFRFDGMESLAAVTNANIASYLARSLLAGTDQSDGEWECDEKAAMLVRYGDAGGDLEGVSVGFDGAQKRLSLRANDIMVVWGKMEDMESFWETGRKCLRGESSEPSSMRVD